jgi:anti-anti-sigma regulatory factor
MLGITTAYRLAAETGAVWVLRLEGRLQGDRVNELRREWQRLRDVAGAVPIQVELEGVEFVDKVGRLLLAEMHREGVQLAGM